MSGGLLLDRGSNALDILRYGLNSAGFVMVDVGNFSKDVYTLLVSDIELLGYMKSNLSNQWQPSNGFGYTRGGDQA